MVHYFLINFKIDDELLVNVCHVQTLAGKRVTYAYLSAYVDCYASLINAVR